MLLGLPVSHNVSGEREFSEFLNQLGRGATTAKPSIFKFVSSRRRLIEFCYPKPELENPLANANAWSKSAILAPTRAIVDELNDVIIGKLVGSSKLYYAATTPTDSVVPAGETAYQNAS